MQKIGTIATINSVIAPSTKELISADITGENVIACISEKLVIPGTTRNAIISRTRKYDVDTITAANEVVPNTGVQ